MRIEGPGAGVQHPSKPNKRILLALHSFRRLTRDPRLYARAQQFGIGNDPSSVAHDFDDYERHTIRADLGTSLSLVGGADRPPAS
jgi:hypothetical protein